MDPSIAASTIIIADFINGKPIQGIYDDEALRELNRMVIRARNNDPEFFQPMVYWDMHEKIKRH